MIAGMRNGQEQLWNEEERDGEEMSLSLASPESYVEKYHPIAGWGGAHREYAGNCSLVHGPWGGDATVMRCCGVAGIVGLHEIELADVRAAAKFYARANYGILQAITNSEQGSAEMVLEKAGFERAMETFNPNSGNTITVWLLDLNGAKDDL